MSPVSQRGWIAITCFLVLIVGAALPVYARPQPPKKGVKAVDPKLLQGTWRGESEEDGALTITISGNKLAYVFGDGAKYKDQGTFKVAEGGLLFFTPEHEEEAEQWVVLLDADGKSMLVLMEEDNLDDEETFRLSKEAK